jgi:hypothetical protein
MHLMVVAINRQVTLFTAWLYDGMVRPVVMPQSAFELARQGRLERDRGPLKDARPRRRPWGGPRARDLLDGNGGRQTGSSIGCPTQV